LHVDQEGVCGENETRRPEEQPEKDGGEALDFAQASD